MADKITLALAPVGGWGKGKGNPLEAKELSNQVIECASLGASLVHFHSRDISGNLSTDIGLFDKTATLIKTQSDIIIEASSGGISDMTDEERIRPASCQSAQLASLNLGSLNFGDHVYRNSLPSIRFWIESLKQWKVHPSLEIFDTGNVEIALHLIHQDLLTPPYNFSFIFDCKWGMAWSPELLKFLMSRLPKGSHWGCIFVGSKDFSAHLESARLGAHFLRTGFEDSMSCKGSEARSNMELVSTLEEQLQQQGFEPRTIEESKALLVPS